MEKGPFPISIQKYKLLGTCLQKASNVGYNIILNKEGKGAFISSCLLFIGYF